MDNLEINEDGIDLTVAEHEGEEGQGQDAPKKRGRKTKIGGLNGVSDEVIDSGQTKIKLALEEDKLPEGFLNLITSLKKYGVKDIPLTSIVTEALNEVSQDDWDLLIDKVTPFEYKIKAAMEDPELKEKLMNLLKLN